MISDHTEKVHLSDAPLLKFKIMPGHFTFDEPKISHFKDRMLKYESVCCEKNKDFTELPF